MQVHRTIDQINGIVYTTITGEISFGEIQADMMRLAGDVSYTPQMPGLVDMRQASSNMTPDEIVNLSEFIKNNPRVVNGARRALLVNTEVMYGIYRMFESFSSGGTVCYQVFRDEEEALTWLLKA